MSATTLEQTKLEQIVTNPQEEPEKEFLRHIVNPPANLHIWRPGMTAQDIVDIARVRRIEVVALCGARFIPTRNPEDVKKTCDECMDEAGRIMGDA